MQKSKDSGVGVGEDDRQNEIDDKIDAASQNRVASVFTMQMDEEDKHKALKREKSFRKHMEDEGHDVGQNLISNLKKPAN